MAYGFFTQMKKDSDFTDECEHRANQLIPLVFTTPHAKDIKQLNLHIKSFGATSLYKTINVDIETNEFTFNGGFSTKDTIEITNLAKLYKVYGFQYHAITINEKKGLECRYKGAYLNGKWVEDKLFILD